MSRSVAIVTGAGGGIAGASSRALARDGHDLVLVDVDAATLAQTAADAREAGARAIELAGDATDPQLLSDALDRGRAELGEVTVAVPTVAHEQHAPAPDMTGAGLSRAFDGTVRATYELSRQVAERLIAAERPGRIVVIGSLHGWLPFAGCLSYNVAEAAQQHLARSLARDLLRHRIAVNLVEPGWVRTPGESDLHSEEQLDEAERQMPLGRMAAPEDIAEAVAFLASGERAPYITGAVLRVDGGMSLDMARLPGGGTP
jgi:NAD(P)-dependent dehydrogenase (short-subunit alcohol dehydrogenase family)